MKTEGEALKIYIEEKHINKTQLAKALKMSRTNLYQLFESKQLEDSTKNKISKHLRIAFDNIYNFQPNPKTVNTVNEDISDYGNDVFNKLNYYKGQVDLLKELLREKEVQEQRIQPNEITIPLDIRDLISESDMAKTQRFLGNDFYRSSICVSDKFGKIEYVNDEFTNQTGYTIADIKGKSAGEILQRNDVDKAVKKKMHDALINRTYFEGEVLNYSKTGDQIKCRLIIAPIKIKGIEKLISLAVFSKVNVLKYN